MGNAEPGEGRSNGEIPSFGGGAIFGQVPQSYSCHRALSHASQTPLLGFLQSSLLSLSSRWKLILNERETESA